MGPGLDYYPQAPPRAVLPLSAGLTLTCYVEEYCQRIGARESTVTDLRVSGDHAHGLWWPFVKMAVSSLKSRVPAKSLMTCR